MLVKNIILLVLLDVLGVSHGKKGFGSGEQEWNYVNVRPGAHMFWWLYYTSANVTNYYEKPLIIWLQGGPGQSSTGYGNFGGIGPLDLNLNYRNYTWVKDYNVLFIDSPVGTGYSYTTSSSALTITNEQIALDLLYCIEDFLKQLPRFAHVPTYINAESYGGKMAVEFALIWYKAQKRGQLTSNLKGVGLGNSWISPIDSVMGWAPFLFQTGMIDSFGYEKIMESAERIRSAVENREWLSAIYLWRWTELVITNVTNNIDFYNILYRTKVQNHLRAQFRSNDTKDDRLKAGPSDDAALEILMNSEVRKSLELNATWGKQSSQVFITLRRDFMKPVVDKVELLLNETDIRVFVYTGQLDLIVDTPGTLHWVQKLKWQNASKWTDAPREPLVVENVIEGYVKAAGNLKMYWINRAGHMVPTDNPAGMEAMMKDLTSNVSSYENTP